MPTTEERYFNRELSWIEFNRRVFAEALDSTNPLLERLKFLGIVSSNFDEFFMVRVASLALAKDPLYGEVLTKALGLMREADSFFAQAVVPELEKAGIRRFFPAVLSEKPIEKLRGLFMREMLPLLTPIAIREGEALPALNSLSLYVIAKLLDPKKPGSCHYALVEIPKKFPRIVNLASEAGYEFVLAEDLLIYFLGEVFCGFEVAGVGLVRLARAAEMVIDEEKDEDFAEVMAEALRQRRWNDVVRLETTLDGEMLDAALKIFQIDPQLVFRPTGWMDLKSISQISFQPGFENLKRPQWKPCPLSAVESSEDLWELLRAKDVLVHYPYDSFDAFLSFLNQAADDPDVLLIKQTLYRTWNKSAVIAALERAVKNGKQVTVFVELKARFDEESNIEWARHLEQVGALVLYGVTHLKTHAKACLVVRRDPDGIRRYAHLGTGNYNEKTAQIYSDLGLMTSNEALTSDVAAFFNVITGYSQPTAFSKIEMAPFGLRRRFERLILREVLRVQSKQGGLIIAKMNSLVDPGIIEALYRASQKGVKIRLNVRGACMLKPGVVGLSENIEVVSIVDMFLEHSRIFYFQNGGEEEVYLSSADWMPRNLDRRIELLFPVEDSGLKQELVELLKLYFKDNVKSWRLLPEGLYEQSKPAGKKIRAQEVLCEQAVAREAIEARRTLAELKPQKPKK